jgi:ATP-dependent RNA helicase DDX10/DBP4
MVTLLEQNKVPVKVIKVNPKQQKYSITAQLQSGLSEDPELKYLAQKVRQFILLSNHWKAFISYMRSVFLQSNKEVFDVQKLPAEDFAKSLGLVGTPNIKFGKVISC